MRQEYIMFWGSWLIILLPSLFFVGVALWRIGSILKKKQEKYELFEKTDKDVTRFEF